MNDEKYTVMGAGHGGKGMAAHLALMGFSVTLWNRTFDHIEAIKKRGGIDLNATRNALVVLVSWHSSPPIYRKLSGRQR